MQPTTVSFKIIAKLNLAIPSLAPSPKSLVPCFNDVRNIMLNLSKFLC